MTLRAKLTWTATATVAAAMLIVSLGLYLLVQRAIVRDVQVSLRSLATREVKALQRTGRLAPLAGSTAAVLRRDGTVELGNWPARLSALPENRLAGRTQIYRANARGGVYFRALGGGRWLAVAMRDPTGAVTLQRIARYLLILGGAAVLVAAWASYVLAGGVMAPLRRVARTASEIARSGEIDRRLGEIGTGEMGELAAAFDAMLDRLAHAIAQQRQTVERERRFASEAAHVLRNPLATVLLNLEYLEQRLPPGGEAHRAAQDAHAEGRRLLRLTESLLRLARGESVADTATRVDFAAVVREAAAVVAQGRGRAAAGLDVAEGAEVLGDRAALFGMVESIIDNAYKYSTADAKVQVSLSADRGLVRLVVEDRGQGIASEHLPHVFDRFYRARSDGEGSGLGLAIARAVAIAHGGQIHIASELGAFTRVTVELPQAR